MTDLSLLPAPNLPPDEDYNERKNLRDNYNFWMWQDGKTGEVFYTIRQDAIESITLEEDDAHSVLADLGISRTLTIKLDLGRIRRD